MKTYVPNLYIANISEKILKLRENWSIHLIRQCTRDPDKFSTQGHHTAMWQIQRIKAPTFIIFIPSPKEIYDFYTRPNPGILRSQCRAGMAQTVSG